MVLVVGGTSLLVAVLLGWVPARAVARPGQGWAASVADAALAGLVLGLVALQVLEAVAGWAAVALLVGLEVCFLVLARRQGTRLRPEGGVGPWALLAAAVCLAAALLRLRPQVMMAWTGDQGAYVMNAIEFANGFDLNSQFPRGFPLYMSPAAFFLGPEDAVSGVPLLGVLLVVAVMRLCHQLDLPKWVAVLAGATLAAHPSAIYFSTFPGSEALQAVLTVYLVAVVVGLLHADLPGPGRRPVPLVAVALLSGLLMFALGITRISAPVLLLPLVLALLACLAPSLRRHVVTLAAVLAGGSIGAATALLLQLVRSNPYALRQLGDVLPASVVERLGQAGLLQLGWRYPAAALLVVALVAGWALLLRRLPGGRDPAGADPSDEGPAVRRASVSWTATVLSLAAGVACLLLLQAEGPGEVTAGLARYGWLLLLLPLGAPLLPLLGSSAQAVGVLVLSWGATLFLYVHTVRFDAPKVHTYYLYWDRYLYSEVFPIAVVLGGCSLGAAVLLLGRVRRPVLLRRFLLAGVPVLAVALVVVSLAVKPDVYRNVFSGPQLEGVADIQADLADTIDEDVPLLWGASSELGLQPNFFPNTWFALGLTYSRMNGADLRELQYEEPFRPDRVLTARRVRVLACSTGSDVQVAEVTGEDGVPGPERWGEQVPELEFEVQGVVEGEVSWLRQEPVVDDRDTTRVEITVYRLEHDGLTC